MNGYRCCTETYCDNKSEPIPTMNGYRQLHPFCVLNWLSPVVPRSCFLWLSLIRTGTGACPCDERLSQLY